MTIKTYVTHIIVATCLVLSTSFLYAQKALPSNSSNDSTPQILEWKVGDTMRKAMVYIPPTAKTTNTPIIFVFHGHGGLVENGKGGTMESMYRTRRFDQLWPEAIFICPQGLNTPGQLVDKEGKFPGWQKGAGELGDRDLKFFDTMLAFFLKNYKIDQSRIYSTGHSNGGGFTYLLWATRGSLFAAVAPSAAGSTRTMSSLKPKPVLHVLGEKDTLVKAAWQINTCEKLLKLNDCDTNAGKPFAKYATIYPSATNNPVVIYRHPGGHGYPPAANKVIIDFFKLNSIQK